MLGKRIYGALLCENKKQLEEEKVWRREQQKQLEAEERKG
jgi:hypothetical protein